MLHLRLLLGTVLIALVVLFCWLDARATTPLTYLLPLAILLSVAASAELVALFKSAGLRPIGPLVCAGNAAIVASNGIGLIWLGRRDEPPLERLAWPLLALAVCVLAALVGEMRRYQKPGGVTVNLAAAMFAFVYVGLLFSFLAQLRALPPASFGIALLAATVATVKLADIGAYTVGRLIGRHKMAPVLSPGKTIEGAAGALVFASLGAYLVFSWLAPQAPWRAIAFGLIVGTAGIAGDLAESLLKRDLGQKDSSHWVPGFGGVLDVLDSVLFAAPVAYLCVLCGLVIGQ